MKVVKISDPAYPCLLKQIADPPKVLYYKGNWDAHLFDQCLAVVGSRRMTSYGRHVTDELVSGVATAGVTIVSGFMYGVDAQAHRATVSRKGKTIAVMPCGIDLIHPAYQEELYEQILATGGLILSEFETDFPPASWTYPRRNRIVAGLSQATLVIEAARNSGSLITAHYTKDNKRTLFAVPGPLTSSVSEGCLELIREGAAMAMGADDILVEYGLMSSAHPPNNSPCPPLSAFEKNIVAYLAEEPREIDTLSRLTNVPASELGATLSLMELEGVVREEEGKYYVTAESLRFQFETSRRDKQED